ncbi:MAG: C40 family peptidase [Aureispira sp.]|nr:C40 family peptidase [Aureispira sp.]
MGLSSNTKGLKIAGVYFLSLATFCLFISAKVVSSSVKIKTSIISSTIIEAAKSDLIASSKSDIEIEADDLTGIKYVVNKKRERRQRRAERAANPHGGNHGNSFVAASTKIVEVPVQYDAILDSIGRTSVRGKLLVEAKKHIGTKYVWASARPGAFDCSGFTSYVMGQNGIKITRSSRYQAKQGKAVEMDNVKPGDLIFFSKHGKGGRVTHVAMVVDNTKEGIHVIHATRRGIVVDNLTTSKYWMPKVLYAKDMISI